jgi:hypothetical protein
VTGGAQSIIAGEERLRRTGARSILCRAMSQIGAPRPTKMGTIASPWHYDAAARHALQSASLRRPAILHYDS